MNSGKQISSYDIVGGLQAVVSDDTCHYFGGYYQVKLRVSVEVGLSEGWFDSLNTYRDALSRLGERVTFTRTFEKLGVPEQEIGSVRENLLNAFEANLLPYLNRDDFARRFASGEYRKAVESAAKPCFFPRD